MHDLKLNPAGYQTVVNALMKEAFLKASEKALPRPLDRARAIVQVPAEIAGALLNQKQTAAQIADQIGVSPNELQDTIGDGLLHALKLAETQATKVVNTINGVVDQMLPAIVRNLGRQWGASITLRDGAKPQALEDLLTGLKISQPKLEVELDDEVQAKAAFEILLERLQKLAEKCPINVAMVGEDLVITAKNKELIALFRQDGAAKTVEPFSSFQLSLMEMSPPTKSDLENLPLMFTRGLATGIKDVQKVDELAAGQVPTFWMRMLEGLDAKRAQDGEPTSELAVSGDKVRVTFDLGSNWFRDYSDIQRLDGPLKKRFFDKLATELTVGNDQFVFEFESPARMAIETYKHYEKTRFTPLQVEGGIVDLR